MIDFWAFGFILFTFVFDRSFGLHFLYPIVSLSSSLCLSATVLQSGELNTFLYIYRKKKIKTKVFKKTGQQRYKMTVTALTKCRQQFKLS